MDENAIRNSKLEILANISDILGGRLHTDRYGLIMEHINGTIRWMQLDLQTCALIFDIAPKTNLSFKLKDPHSEPFFHSLFLSEGNVVFSGFEERGNLKIIPREFLFFHSLRHTLNIAIEKGKNCQLVLISHSLVRQGDFFTGFQSKRNLELGFCNCDSSTILKSVFAYGLESKASFELKGSLFLLLGKTLPVYRTKNSSNNIMGGKPRTSLRGDILVDSKSRRGFQANHSTL